MTTNWMTIVEVRRDLQHAQIDQTDALERLVWAGLDPDEAMQLVGLEPVEEENESAAHGTGPVQSCI